MVITTDLLDKAAFFTTFGAKIVEIKGKCPDNTFIIETPGWLVVYENFGGWVPYNRFCNQRRALKRQTRKLAGLPENFTGNRPDTFKLGDFAMIRPKYQDKFKEALKKGD